MEPFDELKFYGQDFLDELVFLNYQRKIGNLAQSSQVDIKSDIDYLVYKLGNMRGKSRLRTLGQIIILMKINILRKHCI